MKKSIYVLGLLMVFSTLNLTAQEEKKTDYWTIQKDKIRQQEKDSLKVAIEKINKKRVEKEISTTEAKILISKAEKRAEYNIDNRIIEVNTRMDKISKDGLEIIVKNNDTIIRRKGNENKNLQKDFPEVETLKSQKEQVILNEKEALKRQVSLINIQLGKKEISDDEAQKLKEEAAKKHALNIENKIAIIDNKIALWERNVIDSDSIPNIAGTRIIIGIGQKDIDDDYIYGLKVQNKRPKKVKYDRRTTSDLIIAFGLNNAIIDNQSLDDSPYKIGGSRFFELGYQWQTRVFKNSNALRINYGLSFQFNGLKPKDNQYFVDNKGQTELQEFQYDLKKAKLRMDNLVIPIHFEFGPSKVTKTEHSIRYSTNKNFKFGIGGYAGLNLTTRQKLKYKIDGDRVKDKIKRDYNTSNIIYGLSAYAGYGDTMFYVKYDLNPIFKDALIEQNNISLGLRFHL